ncbi:MAG: error-prone DNA polymerase [Burkholderiales bacterium]
MPASLPPYAELHCVSNFSFLRGASHPEELVEQAHAQGYAALALTDECSLAGVVRAHLRAKDLGLPLLIGAEFSLQDLGTTIDTRANHPDRRHPPARLILIARNREGYGNLSELITRTRMRETKGRYRLRPEDFNTGIKGCLALLVPSPAVGVASESSLEAAHADRPDPSQPPADAAGPDHPATDALAMLLAQARWLRERLEGPMWITVTLLSRGHDLALLSRLREVSMRSGIALVAAGDVHAHQRSRRSLQDVLTATRLRQPVQTLGFALAANAEQHLRSRLRLARLYPADLLEETLEVAAHCHFSLDSLRYEYPDEIVPAGHDASSWLRALTLQGAAIRYPGGLPQPVHEQLEHEFALITELRYEPYFLTVADIVQFARSRGILCQGRGSAANSAVCYCLGITEVDPARGNLLFERFISRERNEPPDIDVDFEHQRREEVIQYLYSRYGRDRTALAAAISTWRPRSALRDVGRALGIDAQRISLLTRDTVWWDGRAIRPEQFAQAGFDPQARIVQHWIRLTTLLIGVPRHLSQHSGGFVIARDSLARLVPIENAAMPGRSVIQWDKDDLDALGLLKVDVLALGMLSAIRRALELISHRRGLSADPAQGPSTDRAQGQSADQATKPSAGFRIQDIPPEDPDTYAMISAADTVGVFQIESRAQMSMLPRLQPRCFQDLVIEVAIVRPGPIQGGMVHPYLRRRQGLEPVHYPRDEIRPALERTLGVPIFQEQVMQIAILAAGFSPGEADQLRRAMAAWKRKGGLTGFQRKVIDGMLARGYEREFAERIFQQIEGFGEYGFPESHAASFALLVYVSAWIKRHEPAAFLAALLDSQPMGFYAPAQLVRDAREHGIEVLAPCVLHSDWPCSLQERPIASASAQASIIGTSSAPPSMQPSLPADDPTPAWIRNGIDWRPQPAVRMGLNTLRGLSQQTAQRLLDVRAARLRAGYQPAFSSLADLTHAVGLQRHELDLLARADALRTLSGHRAQAAWSAAALTPLPGLLAGAHAPEPALELPEPSVGAQVLAEHRAHGVFMAAHPVSLVREPLTAYGVQPACVLRSYPDGRLARASGLVTHRQRPGTASGVVFITLEDDTGQINVIVWPRLFDRYRKEILQARLMTVFGVWQADAASGGQVMHLVARRVVDHTALLGALNPRSRDFH